MAHTDSTPGLALITAHGVAAAKGAQRMDYPLQGPITDLAEIFGAAATNAEHLTARRAYILNGWFRAAVNLRADAISSLPYTIRTADGDKVLYDSDQDEDLPDEISFLNNLVDLLHVTEASIVLEGRAAWGKQIKRGQLLGVRFWALGTWDYETTAAGITGYTRRIKGLEQAWRPEWVVPFWQLDPLTELGAGNSLGTAARVHADVLHSLDSFLDNYLDGGLLKATLVKVPRGTPQAEREKIDSLWNRWFGGSKGSKRVKSVEADAVDAVTIGEGLKDLSDASLTQEQREAICTALGIPQGKMMSNVTGAKATALEDAAGFYTDTIIPQARRHRKTINTHLLNALGYRINFEFNRLRFIQDAELLRAERFQKLTGNKQIISVAYAQKQLGIEDPDLAREQEEAFQREQQRFEQQAQRLTPGQQEEAAKWRKKVATKGRTAPFECQHLTPEQQAVIKSRLEQGEPVETAFEPPFVGF